MTKRDRKYIALLILALGLAVAAEMATPEEIDWTASFENNDKRPFGGLVFYDLLDELFPGTSIDAVNVPPYLVLRDTSRTDANYLFVTLTFAPDAFETEKLLDFAARGNTVFVAAYDFDGPFADTLRLETDGAVTNMPQALLNLSDDSVGIHLVNPALQTADAFYFEEGLADDYFSRFDTARATVLGLNSRKHVNYLRVDVGGGAVYLSTVPMAFTNYFALHRNNAAYLYRALSYLPVQDVLWDEYYKPNRTETTTPLRFILGHPALKAAYWTLVALLVLFIVFESKRRQRIIPVIAPLKNTTVEFVETVGRLYHQHADHANLAEKKITYFLDYVRHHLGLPTHTLGEDFPARVAERSGVPADAVRAIFEDVRRVQSQAKLSEDDLQRLNDRIEAFYRLSKR